jgi:hypothetical protein
VVLPEVAIPAKNMKNMERLMLVDRYNPIMDMVVQVIVAKNNHLLPILSEAKGINSTDEDHPIKNELPISPILLELMQIRSNCSTQL